MPATTDHMGIWIWNGLALLIAVIIGVMAAWLLVAVARRVARRTHGSIDDALVQVIRGPALIILPVMAIKMVLPTISAGDQAVALPEHLTSTLLIVAVWWLLVALTRTLELLVRRRFRVDVKDNLAARRIQTQVVVLRRAVIIVVTILALAAMLMTFPTVRQFGASLLASAGLAGLVIGMAARPVLQNLLAGVQLALTQPIRLDDVVIVEGEWGRIEEILSSFVVVRLWDERRLVVPLNFFVEHPFQNWTRTTADIIGTVFIYVDYSVPIEAIRQELRRILDDSPHWDRKAWALQVTDLTEHTVQLRALMSATDASTAFSLRCDVRERLVTFLRDRYPGALPQIRAQVQHDRLRHRSAASKPVSP